MNAKTKCSACKKPVKFELVHEVIRGSNILMSLIRCTECKTVVGVLEGEATIDLLKPILKKINTIDDNIEILLARL